MRLGRTGLRVGRVGFGALPIQRTAMDTAVTILRKAYDQGVNYFDTARAYTDSEEKLGRALSDVRKNIFIATKSQALTREKLLADFEMSLKNLKTDYVDLLQLHNPNDLPNPDDQESALAAALELKKAGKTRFVGLTSHRQKNAMEGIASGYYDTMQFPLSYLSSPEDLEVVQQAAKYDVGMLAMKGMCGGLATRADIAFAFLWPYQNVLPLWGIQHEWELDEFLGFAQNPPVWDKAMTALQVEDMKTLGQQYCRGCGYCLPCPEGISIHVVARMYHMIRRFPTKNYLTPEWRESMTRVEKCTRCGACMKRCPYGLQTPDLIREAKADYDQIWKEQRNTL